MAIIMFEKYAIGYMNNCKYEKSIGHVKEKVFGVYCLKIFVAYILYFELCFCVVFVIRRRRKVAWPKLNSHQLKVKDAGYFLWCTVADRGDLVSLVNATDRYLMRASVFD